MDRFGRIDLLVNNAATFYAGFFEELLPEQIERQLSTSLIGPMNVTRAVLPVMRKQRSGLIMTISSTAGLIGFEFSSRPMLTASYLPPSHTISRSSGSVRLSSRRIQPSGGRSWSEVNRSANRT